MQLLFALSGFHRYDRGAEVALLSVAEELARQGVAVTVVGSGQEREDRAYDYVRIDAVARENFEKFPSFPPLRSETAWEDLTFAFNLVRHVDPSHFDATVTCSFPFTHWALRKNRSTRSKHIFVTQNGDWPSFSNKSEYRFFDCDGLVCINPDYQERNRQRWNTALIPNGADIAKFGNGTADRQRWDLPAGVPIILMVSAFIATKRVSDAIDAVAMMDDAYLVVAGDGPLRDIVQDKADRMLPGRYKRLSLTADEMPALYASADAFLHMSLLESFGNVFVEAMAAHLPVVGHDTPRLRWIVGDSEYLGDTRDSNVVKNLLEQALASNGRRRNPNVDRFAWAGIADQYRKFIEQMLYSG